MSRKGDLEVNRNAKILAVFLGARQSKPNSNIPFQGELGFRLHHQYLTLKKASSFIDERLFLQPPKLRSDLGVKRRCRPLARQEKVLLREQAGRRKLGDDLKFLPQHGPFQQLRLVILPAPSVDCRQPNP